MYKDKIRRYRNKAVELRADAEQLQNVEARNVFLRLADSYDKLADELTRLFQKSDGQPATPDPEPRLQDTQVPHEGD